MGEWPRYEHIFFTVYSGYKHSPGALECVLIERLCLYRGHFPVTTGCLMPQSAVLIYGVCLSIVLMGREDRTCFPEGVPTAERVPVAVLYRHAGHV